MSDAKSRIRIAGFLRVVVSVAVCAMLLWGILTAGMAAQAARLRDPTLMAFFSTKSHPDAAAQLALQLFAAKQNDPAISLARMAVENDPLNVKALTTLGLALKAAGQETQATIILRRASSMGWRNSASLVWGIEDAALNDDPHRIVELADALARRQQSAPLTRLVFFGALVEPRMRSAFVQRLAARPSWRPGFFADAHDHLGLAQLDGMEAVLDGLRTTNAPPTAGENLIYIDRMVQLGQIDRAHRYWAKTFAISPADMTSRPFDGHFARAATIEGDAARSNFEWQLNSDLVDILSFVTEAGHPALRLNPGADAGAILASQTLILPPGQHTVQTRLAAGTGAMAPAGWIIACLGSNASLLRTMSGDSRDELTQITVTVPDQGCTAQNLQLVTTDRTDAQPVTITSVNIR